MITIYAIDINNDIAYTTITITYTTSRRRRRRRSSSSSGSNGCSIVHYLGSVR